MPTEHWCKEHKTVWFQKGKMKNFAHPILDENGEPTGQWCNEPKAEGREKKAWQPRGDSPEQRTSIERQCCLKSACEIAKEADTVDTILANAEKMYQWVSGKLGVKSTTLGNPLPATAKPPVSDSVKPTGATKPFDLKEFMAEFTETRTILENAGQEKWKYDTLLARLNEMTGVSARTVPAAISKLTNEQRDSLVKELNEDFKEAK